MSQYTHNTTVNGKPAVAVAGWDRRLGYYMYQVQELGSGDILCSNLNSANAFSANLADAVAAFAKHGITLPEPMVTQLEQDKLNNEGNRVGTF